MLNKLLLTATFLISTLTASPRSDHQIKNILDYGAEIELEDESHWRVASPDVYKVVSWKPDETVILTPNNSWFSFYTFDYYLTNTTQNSYVRVNISVPSMPLGQLSHWVTSIDKFSGILFLDDGTCWKIAPQDHELFQKWSVNDYVIFGHNDELRATLPYLLINVRLKSHVRSDLY